MKGKEYWEGVQKAADYIYNTVNGFPVDVSPLGIEGKVRAALDSPPSAESLEVYVDRWVVIDQSLDVPTRIALMIRCLKIETLSGMCLQIEPPPRPPNQSTTVARDTVVALCRHLTVSDSDIDEFLAEFFERGKNKSLLN